MGLTKAQNLTKYARFRAFPLPDSVILDRPGALTGAVGCAVPFVSLRQSIGALDA